MTQGPEVTEPPFLSPIVSVRSNKAKVAPYLPARSIHPKRHGRALKQVMQPHSRSQTSCKFVCMF